VNAACAGHAQGVASPVPCNVPYELIYLFAQGVTEL